MITLKEKQAKKRAQRNIEIFLEELDAQIPKDADEIYSNNYYSNLFQQVWVVRMLNEYDERKEQAKIELNDFLTQIDLEKKNGFRYLTPLRKRAINIKRKFEAEQIVDNAHLGPEDSNELLVPVVSKIYQRGGFDIPKRYRPYSKEQF